MKSEKNSKKQDSENKPKKSLVKLILKFFIGSIFPVELDNINTCLYKANEINPLPYFRKLRFKNRLIWAVSALPSVSNIIFLGLYFYGENTIKKEILLNVKILKSAVLAKNPDILQSISFSENFLIYLGLVVVQTIILTTMSWAIMGFIKRINPIIKESLELREYCLGKNYSNTEDNLFLVCKAGILAKISESSGDDLMKDKHLWRHLNKIPKEPVESPKDRSIVFIGNGFQLQKYEFKIT